MQPPAIRKQESKLGVAANKLKQCIERKLPVPEEGVKDVVKLIKACTTEELAALGLEPPPLPLLSPALSSSGQLPLSVQLQAVQDVISSLQYNHMPGYYFNVSKARPLPAILATAAAILREPLPIKCIEAVFLGMLLTQGWCNGQLQRIPIGFKSMASNGQVYRHIVLAVHDAVSGLLGALGISRRSNLMFKALAFHCLADLVADYEAAYSGWGHQLIKVRVGLPVEHDRSYTGPVCWRYCTVSPQKRSTESIAAILNQHAAAAEKLQAKFRVTVAARSNRAGSSNPKPSSPQPHITRPHHGSMPAALCSPHSSTDRQSTGANARCGTPTLPASPRLRHNKTPAATNVLRASCPAAVTHIAAKAGGVTSPIQGGSSSCNNALGAAHGSSFRSTEVQQQLCLAAESACDSSSEEEVEFDSDSEVNSVVDSMRHSPVHACS